MKLTKEIVFTEIEDEFYGVPVGADSGDFMGMIKVNSTTKDIIELLKNEISMDELTAAMLEMYDADESRLRADIASITETLKAQGLIET